MRQLILLITLLLISCGGDSTSKKKVTYGQKSTPIVQESQSVVQTPSNDMTATGIGPIDNLAFGEIDQEMVRAGEALFGQKCTACHKIDVRYIGPSLKGIYDRRNPAWVMNIMLNPTEMIKKDPTAIQLLKEYNNVVMYNQNLTVEEARALAEYFRTL